MSHYSNIPSFQHSCFQLHMSNDRLPQRNAAVIGRYQVMSIHIETQIPQALHGQGEEKHVLEHASTQDNAV